MERFIKRVLGKYFEAFFKDFSKDDFHFDTWKGATRLENMEMNETVLQELIGIPQLLVKSCKIASMELNISPTKLSSVPVKVIIDRIELVLCEPEHILPLPMVLAALLGENEEEKAADANDEQEAGEYGLAQKIADGVHVDIGFIGVTIQSLGQYKTETYGEWTPPTGRLEIQGVHVRQTDAEWNHVDDLRVARKSGVTPGGDCYAYREVDITSIKFSLTPYSDDHIPAHKRSVRLIDGLPLKIRMTTRRPKDSAEVLGVQTDVMIARLPIIATPLHLSYVLDNLNGIGETFARQACEGPPFIIECQIKAARGIAAADRGNTSDPYVKATVDKRFFKTATKKKTLTPEWKDELFKWRVVSYPQKEIVLEVHDWDRMSKDDLLGTGKIKLSDIEGLTEGGCACDIWVPLDTQGEVLIAVNIIDPTTVINPGPLSFLNVYIDEIDVRVYEDDLSSSDRRLSFSAGNTKFGDVQGIGLEVHDVALHVVSHPILPGELRAKKTVQLSVQDVQVSLLDLSRKGEDALLFFRPKEVQGNLTQGKEIQFEPATLAQVAAVDMARASGQAPPSSDGAARLSVAEVMRTSARGRAPTVNDRPVERREAASALNPPLIRLKLSTTTPQPVAPELALELDAVLMPIKITADISLVPRFQKLAATVLGECNDFKPPDDVLAKIDEERQVIDRKLKHLKEQKRAKKALEPIRPPPALGVHVQVLAIVLHVPSPAPPRPEGPASVYVQVRDVLVSSTAETEAPKFREGLLTLAESIFPSAPKDRLITADWDARPQIGPRLDFRIPLISVSTRASTRAPLQRLINIRDVSASAEVALVRLLKTIQPNVENPQQPEHIPEGFPLLLAAADVVGVELSMNQLQYTQLMAFSAAMTEALGPATAGGEAGDAAAVAAAAAAAEAAAEQAALDAEAEGDDSGGDWRAALSVNPEQRLSAVKMQQMLSLLPVLVNTRIEKVAITLSTFDEASGKLEPVSRTDLELVELVVDNQASRGVVKLAWKELSIASNANKDSEMEKFLSTLGDHYSNNFFALRIDRAYPSAALLDQAIATLETQVKAAQDSQGDSASGKPKLSRKPSRSAPPVPSDIKEAAVVVSAAAAGDEELAALLDHDDIGNVVMRFGGIGLDGGIVRTAALLNKMLQSKFLIPGAKAAQSVTPTKPKRATPALTASADGQSIEAASPAGDGSSTPRGRASSSARTPRRTFHEDYNDQVELETLQTIESKLMEAWEIVLAAKAACADLKPTVASSGDHGAASASAVTSTEMLPPRLIARQGKKDKDVNWRDVTAEPILHAGYLSMRDGILKKWRNMWFILQHDALLCFKEEDRLCPAFILSIDAKSTVSAVPEEKGKKVPPHAFSVTGTKDSWIVAASDQDIETRWHQIINAHIADLKGGKTKPAPLSFTGAAQTQVAGGGSGGNGPSLSQTQIDRFENQLQLTERALTSAMTDGEQLFARIPRLYNQAIDIRVKELQESLRERDAEIKDIHRELVGNETMIRSLEGKVADAQREAAIGVRNPEMKRRLVRLRELRTAASRAERREAILKPVTVIHHEDAGARETLKQLFVKLKKKEGYKIGLGEQGKPKPSHWYYLKDVSLISYPTVAALHPNKGQRHLAFKIVVEEKKKAITWVLQSLTDDALKTWVLGLQELYHDHATGPEPITEGHLLTRKFRLRLKQQTEIQSRGHSSVVAEAVRSMLQHKWTTLRKELGTDGLKRRQSASGRATLAAVLADAQEQ